MNKRRLTKLIASGAVLGTLLAILSMYDMRHYEGDWTFPSAFDGALILVPNILIFMIALSGIMPKALASIPQPIFYVLIAFVNACSYALLFLIIGVVTELIPSRANAILRGSK